MNGGRGGGGKILLLHGSRQTGDLLLGRVTKLRKRLEKQKLEIVAPTALLEHPDDSEMRTWWDRSGAVYEGLLELTMPQMLELWNQEQQSGNSPFVGILGFSQGAYLAHYCCLAHAASAGSPNEYFSGLQFAILVAGKEGPLPAGFEDAYLRTGVGTGTTSGKTMAYHKFVQTPTLHVWGETDRIILPEHSRGLLSYYKNPQSYVHEGGHHVPMNASSVRIYEEFILRARSEATTNVVTDKPESSVDLLVGTIHSEPPVAAPAAATVEYPDDETSEQQRDEVEALTAIFPEWLRMLSSAKEDNVYEHPIRYQVDLVPSDEGVWPPHPIAIQVQYPPNYPQDSLPLVKLVHENNMMQFSTGQAEALLRVITDAAKLEEGIPCVMSCIYAAREFFESGTMAHHAAAPRVDELGTSSPGETPATIETSLLEDISEDQSASSAPAAGLLPSCSRERIEQCNLQGLEIARTVLNNQMMGGNYHCAENNADYHHGKGGHWRFTIGLVGKPSAGKSTFFNAATAFARQRDDSDNLLGGATMAPHPFTTIDPNVGYCLVPAPAGSCPEDELDPSYKSSKSSIGSTHGRDSKGRRLLPVLLKDVAGLVPGAYQGRGRGNKFLNDLTDADVLIHVLDASGTADVEGNDVGIDTDGTTSPGASDPLNDMSWIRTELVEWVFSNLMFKWDTITRRGRNKLVDMFGGYGQNQATTNNVIGAVEKFMENEEGRERAFEHLASWDEGDVHRLVSAFLGVRFPMALALNKCDLPTSPRNVSNIMTALPVHGAHVGTPLSARGEMNFIRYHIERALGVVHKKQSDDTNDRDIPEGVWACLQSAIALREPMLVFPVADLANYTPLPGLLKYATSDPSLPSAGFVECLKAAGDGGASASAAPSMWNAATSTYYASHEKSPGSSAVLRDVLIMKPGSTVDDVFSTLKNMGALRGDFVRAEATSSLGIPSRPVPRTQKVNRKIRIIKIMTSKQGSSAQKK